MNELAQQIIKVRQRLQQAAQRAGHKPVQLLAVTKQVSVERIEQAYTLGLTKFGESKVQEALPKLARLPQAEWHYIGRLQTNKVKDVVGRFALIHSLDRWKLAEALEGEAAKKEQQVGVLVQVNIGREEQKGGLDPAEVSDFIHELSSLPHLRLEGLMAIPPQTADPEEARPYFRAMFQLFSSLRSGGFKLKLLSMGMSQDFEVAEEEGATLVRIGSLLFGERA